MLAGQHGAHEATRMPANGLVGPACHIEQEDNEDGVESHEMTMRWSIMPAFFTIARMLWSAR